MPYMGLFLNQTDMKILRWFADQRGPVTQDQAQQALAGRAWTELHKIPKPVIDSMEKLRKSEMLSRKSGNWSIAPEGLELVKTTPVTAHEIAAAVGGTLIAADNSAYLPEADGDTVNWDLLAKRPVFVYVQKLGHLTPVGNKPSPLKTWISKLMPTDLLTTRIERVVISESPDLTGKKISEIQVSDKQCLLLIVVENHTAHGSAPMRYRTLNVYSSRRGGNLDPNNLEDVCILKVQPIDA